MSLIVMLILTGCETDNATMEFQEGGTDILTSPVAQDPTTGEWQ